MKLRQQNKEQAKEINRLKEENEFLAEDECKDTYGRCRMYQALKPKYPKEDVSSERTVYRIMKETGLRHRPNRKPSSITKADRDARKSDDLWKRNFTAENHLKNA